MVSRSKTLPQQFAASTPVWNHFNSIRRSAQSLLRRFGRTTHARKKDQLAPRFASITGLAYRLYQKTRHDLADETNTVPLQVHLHELANALQAARNYFDTLRNGACRVGGNQEVETAIVDRLAKQLARAEEAFRLLQDQLDLGGRNER